jgi:hypothetical protein
MRTPTFGALSIAIATLLVGCATPLASPAGPDIHQHLAATVAERVAAASELMAALPAGARVALSAVGDVDGDGDADAVVVLDGADADSSVGDAAARPRVLLLLRRGADGRLTVAVRSANAVPCRRCGGMAGDPLHSIRIAPGGFTLRLEGGSRELWSSEFGFVYVKERDDWRLQRVVHAGLDRAASGAHAERRLTPEEIGEVWLAAFDAADFPADALGR